MTLAFGPEDLQRLAIPIGVVVFVIGVLIHVFCSKSGKQSRDAGKRARAKHPVLARTLDILAVILLVAGLVWFFFFRK